MFLGSYERATSREYDRGYSGNQSCPGTGPATCGRCGGDHYGGFDRPRNHRSTDSVADDLDIRRTRYSLGLPDDPISKQWLRSNVEKLFKNFSDSIAEDRLNYVYKLLKGIDFSFAKSKHPRADGVIVHARAK